MASVSASSVCADVTTLLQTNLGRWLGPLDPPVVLERLPVPEVFDQVQFPALAVTSTGVPEPMTRSGRRWSGVFGVIVALWVQDIDYSETATLTQDYTAAVRACLMGSGRLNWWGFTEDYALVSDPRLAQTLGGGRVSFRASYESIFELDHSAPDGVTLPLVRQHFQTISQKE